MANQTALPKMDIADLYREETFTDRKIGTIRRLTPIKADGTADPSRQQLYLGQAQLMTNMGAVPLDFPIEALSLEEAVQKFGGAAAQAVERAMKEIQDMRREAASSIVIPDKIPGGLGGLGGPGGIPGGGKIKLP